MKRGLLLDILNGEEALGDQKDHVTAHVWADFAELNGEASIVEPDNNDLCTIYQVTSKAWASTHDKRELVASAVAIMRNTTSAIVSSLRALSLASTTAPRTLGPRQPIQHTVRCISHSVLSCSSARQQLASKDALKVPASAQAQSAVVGGVMGPRAQQTRGMKVMSSIKKRCEHCKVRGISFQLLGIVGLPRGTNMKGAGIGRAPENQQEA